ncbi:Rieske 2Fe-2S domain-containing protein [Deinococcus roseus]|uniref:Cytochrome Complex iron-sulfur subunit n=1 Tax=Deinococcus roseus TaxID=392414 RepID=A0ABQ2CYV0_9DEIO|nr:ubiquinol-cytochrome c reductase iron-sulfur subunit [Deinococcus roseus]GGJ34217.1 cytochrome Complex iron-sulfur subunit [Deinococcus roseus]
MSKAPINRRKLLEYWWVLPVTGTFGAFGGMFWYASRVTFGKKQVAAPNFKAGAVTLVAETTQLKKDFDSLDFTYAGVPCVLLRLPNPTQSSVTLDGLHYAAFSRVCTHLGCSVQPLRDPEAAALTFNYRISHPMLGCPCHYSIFDPLQEGQSVFGKALYPLPRLKLSLKGRQIFASGLEPAPGSDG